MIGRLTGKLAACAPDRALLDVQGVGYEVRISLSTYYRLVSAGPAVVSVHVHTHVREDALQLYGFASVEEREAFEQLIAISGIGPRIALAVLSGIGAEELRETVWKGDRERLQKIPGVGRKTAERMLLELRDRMGLDPAKPRPAGTAEGAMPRPGSIESDAVSALLNLGYSQRLAEDAVAAAVGAGASGDAPRLDHVLRAALRSLVP